MLGGAARALACPAGCGQRVLLWGGSGHKDTSSLPARTELGTFSALKKSREERRQAGALDISLHLLKGMESIVGMTLARGGVQGCCCLGEMLS